MRRAGTRGAAVVPRGKAGNKRLAAGEIKKAVSAKKQKAAPPAKGKAGNQGQKQPPPKEESSSPEEREHLPDSLSEELKVRMSNNEVTEPAEQELSNNDGSDKEVTEPSEQELGNNDGSDKEVTEPSEQELSNNDGSDDGSDKEGTVPAEQELSNNDDSDKEVTESAEQELSNNDGSDKEVIESAGQELSNNDGSDKEVTESAGPELSNIDGSDDGSDDVDGMDDGSDDDDGVDDGSDVNAGTDKETANELADKLPAQVVSKDEDMADAKDANKESSDDEDDGDSDDSGNESSEEDDTITEPKTLFIGNLPFTADIGQVKKFFQEAGEVIDLRMPVHEDGKRKGFGYVEFATIEAAQKGLGLNGRELMGRKVKLDFAAEKGANKPRSSSDSSITSKFSVFIKGFDKSLSEAKIRSSLEKHFAGCGEMTRVSIPTDKQTESIRGIAYIDFKDQVSRSKAVALRGSDLDGCELYVDEAIPRDGSRGGRSGGRFGGRSGGRFGGRSGGRFGGRSGGRRGSSRFGGDNRFGGRGRGRGRQG